METCQRETQKFQNPCKIAWQVLIIVLFFFLCGASDADTTLITISCSVVAARIVSVEGVVDLRRSGEQHWQHAKPYAKLCQGDMLRVRSRSRAALRLSNNSMLRLDQKTTITIFEPEAEKATFLDLLKGRLHIITRTPKPFKIRTPFLNASVEGTEFFIGVEQDQASIVVYEGEVTAGNDQGSLTLADRESAIILKDQVPRKEGIVHPVDAVQWALYYPAIIDYRLDEKVVAESLQPIWRTSIELYRQGRLFEALALLDQLDPQTLTPHLLTYRAGLMLSLGRVDEARNDIEQALRLQPNDSDAYALKAIIAVVQNDKENSLNLANHAVELDRTSATARLALSYAQQAQFQIEQALGSVEEAVRLDAKNALVWARLAELHMSTGYLDRALESAQQAVNLNPHLGKTQTVLGFAHLLRIDTQKAKVIFSQAIKLDQADPMPRLGLGLALIREGKLETGRVEIEIAASLDSANSLIRSYLGKAYFEEKRYPLASTQFDLAKERDPNDPTPWFYDAIQKQTQNRPVEALRDIQKSIELNDNRAVYRSKLLLDQDQAARGSSLARIYDNLGFEKRALMETAKSLSFDPFNHSAHRFLSDTYANIPRHEIARVSELLQAQLLQPINVNPVQPHLAVADLNIITGTGPGALGFNEFAPLMERNGPQLVASGIFGSNNTLGDEVVVSAVYDRASISLGQFHYNTRGFRRNDLNPVHHNPSRSEKDEELIKKCGDKQCPNNNDLTHSIYNAFLQYALTPKLNLQAELMTRKTEHGDFSSDNFYHREYNPISRRELNEDSVRIGARYLLSPNQNFLMSAKYIDRSERLTNEEYPATGKQIEGQHIHKSGLFSSIIGGGVYRYKFEEPSLALYLPRHLDRENIYAYTNINNLHYLSVTLGLSYDSFSSTQDKAKKNKINPKFGVQWDINESFRLRAAWFETTKSHLIGQQTLEPTQIAGFNQLFDDPNGTRARRMGAGLDVRISSSVFGGIEASERRLYIPFLPDNGKSLEELQKQREQLYRLYLYWVLNSSWVVKGELQYEGINRSNIKYLQPERLDTISAPISIEYFDSSGFFAKFLTTYVNQEQYLSELPGSYHNDPWNGAGSSNFVLVDSVIGFRLPNRRGIFGVEIRNLLDKEFLYRNPYFFISESQPKFYTPTRTIFGRLTLNF